MLNIVYRGSNELGGLKGYLAMDDLIMLIRTALKPSKMVVLPAKMPHKKFGAIPDSPLSLRYRTCEMTSAESPPTKNLDQKWSGFFYGECRSMASQLWLSCVLRLKGFGWLNVLMGIGNGEILEESLN